MAKKYIKLIKTVAAKVRDSKLQKLGNKETTEALNALVEGLGLDGKEEAIIFAAIFDRSCSGRSSDLGDLACYFDCAQLDVLEYAGAISTLQSKGLIVQSDPTESRRMKKSYIVSNYVIECIMDNIMPEIGASRLLQKEFDKYDFCSRLAEQLEDRNVSSEELLQTAKSMEKENSGMSFISSVKKELAEINHRVLFYDICSDFISSDGCPSDIDSTLSDMYGSFYLRLKEKNALTSGNHPLIQSGLIEVNTEGERMSLSEKGKKLLLGEDYTTLYSKYNNLDRYKFAKVIRDYIYSREYDTDSHGAEMKLNHKVYLTEDNNPGLAFIQKLRNITERGDVRALFYLVCNRCTADTGFNLDSLDKIYSLYERKKVLKQLKEETHILQKAGLVELQTKSSLFGECTEIYLTDKGKQLYFEEDAALFIDNGDNKNRIKPEKITQKRLFFPTEQQEQLSLVENALEEENYQALISRLEAKGMPKGVAVLLYGAPGTGKTETVMQWARKCGREIIHVDISASKSMWYGESEKIVKKIFSDYRSACSAGGKKPILLFNEADAIFSTRREVGGSNSSIDQTENTIQNIILEEMEKLDGILIATTNLQDNLDAAFERRFLFKIRYEKPSVEAKKLIWKDKLTTLSDEQALNLSTAFDFSGGEIDNIVRKATMEEVISGKQPTAEDIYNLCAHEKLSSRSSGTRIGF